MSSGSYQLSDPLVLKKELERLRLQSERLQPLEKKILKEEGLGASHKVIELGSGPGFISKVLLDLIPEGELLATEISPVLFDILRENLSSFSNVRSVMCSAENIDIGDGWADFIYGRFIFQHLAEPQNVLNECYRCCNHGGRLAVVDSDDGFVKIFPEIESVNTFLDIARDEQKKRGGNRYIGREIHSLMAQAGFKQIKSRVLQFTPSDLSPETFLHIFFGFKSTLISDKDLIAKAYAEFQQALLEGNTFVSLGIVVTSGVK